MTKEINYSTNITNGNCYVKLFIMTAHVITNK
jgi:hypothetical protein